MATSIEVNKQNVKQLLESGKTNKFIIPEYQRPFAWTDEQVQTLFYDLLEYTSNDSETSYFLGSIVSYENEYNQQEIIDGQQRITTLFLLLRAIYTKLEHSQSIREVENFKREIAPALWKKDKLTGDINFEDVLIESKVMNSEGNEIFAKILETGEASAEAKDNYSLNYILLQELINEYAMEDPLSFYNLIYNILNHAILLPIKADSQDTALTIFSTLNDRGLPLSDADIFKAKIYNKVDSDLKDSFIRQWQELDERSTDTGETIQKLFYYYMFYLRALDKDRKTTTPGIRKYYSKNNFEKLYDPMILDNLDKLLNLWVVVNNHESVAGEKWTENINIKATLDALSSYPNEFWKYPVTIYYLEHYGKENFEKYFLNFLRKLLASLASRYVLTPTINAVKTAILNLNANIPDSMDPIFEFNPVNEEELKEKIKNPHRNTVRMILKVLAYESQEDLLPLKWEIEHIFPRKWQDSYFPNTNDDEIREIIEHIGNKVPFEKKLNIVASNGYFEKKKYHYSKSTILITKELSTINTNNWDLDNIREKDIRISDKILSLFREWGLNRNDLSEVHEEIKPTSEELRQMEYFKSQGWFN